MNCEQVEAIVLDLDRDDTLDSLERAAALAHVSHCPRCAALQESWQVAKEELRALSEETSGAVAPARVEMRLRQEYRTRHRTMAVRRGAIVTAWALAAAALILGAISWRNWEQSGRVDVARRSLATPSHPPVIDAAAGQIQASDNLSAALSSGDDLGDFTPLPGSAPDLTEQAEILRVRMQRGSLGALGLPVNEQRAGDWIQVDLLVGSDGLPEAVRLAQEEN
ncbi:MAG: hypothetical protein ACYDCG_05310 [Candidatus Acidiferrales bacterium]